MLNIDHEFRLDDFEFAHAADEKLIDRNYSATSYAKDVWNNFKKNKGALIGIIVIVIITVMAIVGPNMNDYTYKQIHGGQECLVPRVPGIEKLGILDGYHNGTNQYVEKDAADVYYWFGSDTQGRDIWTRVWSGTRVSLTIALAAVVIDIVIGMVYGLVSGFFGGMVDSVMQRFAEILNGIPTLVIVTLLGMVLPAGITSIIFALMLTGWIGMERIARAQVLKVKEQEFVLASRTLGANRFRIIFSEILPNILGQVIVTSMFSIPNAIFLEAYLSFLGLGVPAPMASLGSLVSDGYKSMTTFPHILIIPVIVMAVLMLCFNLFADGLRDAFDPKMLNKSVVSMESVKRNKNDRVLFIRDLNISFKTAYGTVRAIRGVRLDLFKGETIAIVGESGSGKSVTVKTIMGILDSNGVIDSGQIIYKYKDDNGEEKEVDLVQMSQKDIRYQLCGKHIAMVFQDPMTSLDPTMQIGKQIMEPMREHYHISREEAKNRALELLTEVGIDNPDKRFRQYPHELSGGMRQRVVIAIALACDPDILICDEPTTALDVTIQAKILELIKDLQDKKGISVIYITHDLGVVAKVADYVAVMYAGRIVEKGKINEVFYDPRHPYTWGLLSSMPDIDTDSRRLFAIPGSPPNLMERVKGDAFAPRNPFALNIDYNEEPPMYDVGGQHRVASWLCDPRAPKVDVPEELKVRIEKMKKEAEQYE